MDLGIHPAHTQAHSWDLSVLLRKDPARAGALAPVGHVPDAHPALDRDTAQDISFHPSWALLRLSELSALSGRLPERSQRR